MDREELKEFIKEFLKAWEHRNEDKLSKMYAAEVTATMDEQTVGYKDIMNRLQYSKNNFQNVTNELKDLIIDGEKVVARIKQTLVAKKDGKANVYHIIAIYRVLNNKIVEMWSSFSPNVNYLKNE